MNIVARKNEALEIDLHGAFIRRVTLREQSLIEPILRLRTAEVPTFLQRNLPLRYCGMLTLPELTCKTLI